MKTSSRPFRYLALITLQVIALNVVALPIVTQARAAESFGDSLNTALLVVGILEDLGVIKVNAQNLNKATKEQLKQKGYTAIGGAKATNSLLNANKPGKDDVAPGPQVATKESGHF